MANSNDELVAKIERRSPAAGGSTFENQIAGWFKVNQRRLITLCGDKSEANKLIVTLLHVANRSPQLKTATLESIGECLMHSAALGLFPGAMQECAYLPYKGIAKFIPQYQGLCKLAYNSGFVRSISADVVYDGDEFYYEKGTSPVLSHTYGAEREVMTFAWCVVKLKQGDPVIEVMPIDGKNSIRSIMQRSPSVRGGKSSPWDTDFSEMAKKTVLKRALKTIPKNTELAQALELDVEKESSAENAKLKSVRSNRSDGMNITASVVDEIKPKAKKRGRPRKKIAPPSDSAAVETIKRREPKQRDITPEQTGEAVLPSDL